MIGYRKNRLKIDLNLNFEFENTKNQLSVGTKTGNPIEN
jgi:hypothetical protein